MNTEEIAQREMDLNIQNQFITPEETFLLGYEFEKGLYIFRLFLPENIYINERRYKK